MINGIFDAYLYNVYIKSSFINDIRAVNSKHYYISPIFHKHKTFL